MGVGAEVLRDDKELANMIECALSTPLGYAYIRTACVACFMGVSLATTWKKHGSRLLETMEAEIASERRALASGSE